MITAIDGAYEALKIEAATEVGDKLSRTQRFDTGRLANSTDISGRRLIKFDAGRGSHMRASRTELRQQAESVIPLDRPQDLAHVSEGAGISEGGEYGGYVERRYGLAQAAVDATAVDGRVVARAERRAERALRGKI